MTDLFSPLSQGPLQDPDPAKSYTHGPEDCTDNPPMAPGVAANALQQRLHADPAPVLIHVLPEEIFRAKRIPGSFNACVYETAFVDKVNGLGIDPDREVVVYGAGDGSRDAWAGREKLCAAGYRRVMEFAGGLADWEAAGLPLEGDGKVVESPIPHGRYVIDTEASVVRWTGRNLFNFHYGTVRVAGGEFVLDQGTLVSGSLVMDMNTIACEDLTDSGWNAMLIRHLHDADFFDVANHPHARFVAESVTPLENVTEGIPGHLLKGQITVRGVSRPLEIPVVIACADGRSITGQAQFELDRTQFGSLYGSGKFFRFLGKHVVNDHFHLLVKLHAVAA